MVEFLKIFIKNTKWSCHRSVPSQDGKTVRDSETQELELGQEIDLSQQL